MEREAVLVAIDIGTSKVVALIGEVTRDGALNIIGKGSPPAAGLKKGVVINIDQTTASIKAAIEGAERLSGYKLESAFVGVAGSHVESQNSRGAIAVSGPRREVSDEDVMRATEVARAVQIPSNREVLHVLPRDFIVDGQEGVKDPLGMSAVRLEVETHIVHASATAVQNLSKCVQGAGIRIDELVASSLGSAEAVLSDTEKELGVAVADLGAGTTDLALFVDGSPFHTAVLPIGGINVTNDVAIGLKTGLDTAEALKMSHGTCDRRTIDPDEIVRVGDRDASLGEVTDIIEARMREIFEKIGEHLSAAGDEGMLPAGLVVTGGAAQLRGVAQLGREVLQMPVRVAAPGGVGGLVDNLLTPSYATSIGLLLWGARTVTEDDGRRYETAPARGSIGRMRDWVRGLFP